MHRIFSEETILQAQQKWNNGQSFRSIGRDLNIHHSVISYWQKKKWLKAKIVDVDKDSESYKNAYSYILGLYLGDGYINATSRAYRLRITLDEKYPTVIEQCKLALEILLPNNKVSIINKNGCKDVSIYSNKLLELFPQHGLGYKSNRDVGLLEWQLKILDDISFIRGLMHSDGCRYINKVADIHYVNYSFANTSRHISASLCWALRRQKIYFTIVHRKLKENLKPVTVIYIRRKQDVIKLDNIGCKKD